MLGDTHVQVVFPQTVTSQMLVCIRRHRDETETYRGLPVVRHSLASRRQLSFAMTPSDPQNKEKLKILVAEDHSATRDTLAFLLQRHEYEVVLAGDGLTAHEALDEPDGPCIALLDWMLPGMTGLEVCKKLQHEQSGRLIYFIIITARDSRDDLQQAFDAGADDFIRKPCEAAELLARIRSGKRVIDLEHRLSARVKEVEHALKNVQQLQRLLPICMYCKKVRDDSQYWQEIDEYIHVHTGTDFSHGICPACMAELESGGMEGAARL